MLVSYRTNHLMCRCNIKEMEVEKLKKQLQNEEMSRKKSASESHHCSEDGEQQLSDETKDLQCRLDEERRRSANFELQVRLH